MKLIIDIPEVRYKDIQRIAEVQLECNHFKTAEQIIAKGIPLEQEPVLDKIRAEIADLIDDDDKFDEFSYGDTDCDEYYKAVLDALEIIDKYN